MNEAIADAIMEDGRKTRAMVRFAESFDDHSFQRFGENE